PPRRTTRSSLRRTSRPTARDAVFRSIPPRRARSSSDVRASPLGFVSRYKTIHAAISARVSAAIPRSTKPFRISNLRADRRLLVRLEVVPFVLVLVLVLTPRPLRHHLGRPRPDPKERATPQ